ncbi:PHTF1 [Bugula neritina]|uniref:PHTF1 n=1 Tax=Bugula neritina TaxID=10212 RepID=A0A7J7JG77_BUGNE|nr:PHTF1 [Bugula neritina]
MCSNSRIFEKMENTKLLSESSEEVEEPLSSARRTEDNADTDRDTFEDHDFDDDEGSVCSNGEEAIPPTYKLHADKLTTLPDVAITARTAHSNNRHNVLLSQKLKLKCNKDRVISPTGESEETSDLDSPNKVWTSDNEWENNRVCNSDVADNSSDSSSEYVSDNQPEDDLSAEGPISLKEKLPNSLAYVPSFYDRITCIVWENGVCKKVDLSVVELGGQIERQVANIDYDSNELLFCALLFSVLIASFPFLFRFYHSPDFRAKVVDILLERQSLDVNAVRNSLSVLFGTTWQELVILINGVIQRLFLCAVFCFLISVAEKSYWQRLQFAKFFCYLTSARKSCKHGVPHFRLNKVKNIKIWLSLRAYLKKRGPQRSVEVIVGSVFGLMVVFLAAMCVQLLSDIESFIRLYGNWELSLCCLALMIYLLRFYSLGTRITKKYRNLSTIITEQINLYLHMEQKPYKKEELLVANAVLKLAESLIKEIESPYKMSTTVINPVVFNVTRVAMLSAFSAVISELLGFKLKLHKVKIG